MFEGMTLEEVYEYIESWYKKRGRVPPYRKHMDVTLEYFKIIDTEEHEANGNDSVKRKVKREYPYLSKKQEQTRRSLEIPFSNLSNGQKVQAEKQNIEMEWDESY